MSRFAEDLVQALTEAVEFARHKEAAARASVIAVPDVRAIRLGLHVSQQKFAGAFHTPLATIKNRGRAGAHPMPRPRPISRQSPASRR